MKGIQGRTAQVNERPAVKRISVGGIHTLWILEMRLAKKALTRRQQAPEFATEKLPNAPNADRADKRGDFAGKTGGKMGRLCRKTGNQVK